MSTHPTARESHELHEQNRIDAARAARVVRDMADQDKRIRRRERQKVIGFFVQQPHHYDVAVVRERRVSPRRAMDVPDLPGGPSSDFEGCSC